MPIGITSYGVYIPKFRIKIEEIARVWGDDAEDIKKGLKVFEKSVPDKDEDAATIAVEAARHAINRSKLNPQKIGAIYVGSESHPYVVKPTATIVAEATGATPELMAADYEFACKGRNRSGTNEHGTRSCGIYRLWHGNRDRRCSRGTRRCT